jgi:hypothetical protein
MKPPLSLIALVDQIQRPECIQTAGEMPKLDPRPMPRLARGASARCRTPLWRPFDKLGD